MSFVIYSPAEAAIQREKLLTVAGIAAGYFPENERYDFGGLVTVHPTEDKAAIEIYRSKGVVTPLSEPDILPCNYEPLFTDQELSEQVEALPADWFNTTAPN